jgi:Ca-activated chloride channel family protein
MADWLAIIDEFRLLRPWWLLALPVAIAIVVLVFRGRGAGGGWRRIVDASLQPYVLAAPETEGEKRIPLIVALAACAIAALALAGPTWERLPVPTFRSNDALVVALDLSRSMDAQDVRPSRLDRAKLKLLSLLDRRGGGETALVVFSAHAFTVTPLTTDTRTIASLVGALRTDIMPSRGSLPEAGLEKAATLLRQAGLNSGEILLLSDADTSPRSRELARELRAAGFPVSVLAVGTEEGAPIPNAEGGFLTDNAGQVVVPSLDLGGLQRLAAEGGGRFAQLSPDDRDLDALFPETAGVFEPTVSSEGASDYEADVWRESGIWLAVALLPLVALAFRRGWVCVWLAVLLLPLSDAQALEWPDLWKRSDQRGMDAMRDDDPERAAELFSDPAWRGAAEYRAGAFSASAETLARLADSEDPEAHYNRGNALARSGQLEPAIASYERTLELNPEHEDAAYNKRLVEELLEQMQSEQQNQQQSQQPNASEEQQADASGSGEQSDSGESSGADENQAENQSASNDSQSQPGQGQSDQTESSDDFGDDQSPDSDLADESADPGDDAERQASSQTAPEDLERWASDQAADQWLRRIPQDPGGLLRRKFLYQYQRLGVDQDGNYVWPGDETAPW